MIIPHPYRSRKSQRRCWAATNNESTKRKHDNHAGCLFEVRNKCANKKTNLRIQNTLSNTHRPRN